LANRLIKKVCKKFFYTFPQTKKHLPSSAEWVGSPLRPEIANASAQAGFDFLGWEQNGKPLLFVVGGSLGSERLNKALHKILPQLVEQLRVVHVTGEGKKIDFKHKNYSSHAFIRGEYADVLAAADFVLARAGANSIFEFLALQKPMLLMPLGAGSRGDQIENAQSFLQRGWAQVIDEQALDDASLEIAIENLQASAGQIKQKQSEYKAGNALEKIWQSISADLGPVS
jgi:UDP-N-acetylglucosamine--N-acetylmuramyl-(pentapeptide) pyrophosphoryl-undecaprenol N-acetylglucosamine transferase